jgi:hypothetical protein
MGRQRRSCVQGLKHLHDKRILHRDLKPYSARGRDAPAARPTLR